MSSTAESYQCYRGLPALAGLGSIADAAKPGLSVEACVARHKRYHYAFRRLHEIFTARITAEPIYELKTAFSHHAYLCAEHVSAIRTRVGEMREPPLGLEAVPHAALEQFFDEIRAAPTTAELLVGLYEKTLPALDAALERHIADTNLLADAPSVRVCRIARMEVADMIAFGSQAIGCLADDAGARQWRNGWNLWIRVWWWRAGWMGFFPHPPAPSPKMGEGEKQPGDLWLPPLHYSGSPLSLYGRGGLGG